MKTARAVHGTAVALDGRTLLILGPSGSGKSSIALEMIALGAKLIADDLVAVSVKDGALIASAPDGGPRLIEARGIGLLSTPAADPAPISLVLDLGEMTDERLPETRRWVCDGESAQMIRRPVHLSAAALRAALLSGGPVDPETPVGDLRLAPEARRDQSVKSVDESAGKSPDAGARGIDTCLE